MAGNLIAFDIGESQVKLVQLSGGTVKNAVAAELPDQMVSGGEILSMDAMADFLRDTARKNGIPLGAAALVLPAGQVFTRRVETPPMTEGQLSYNLPFEFKDYLTQEKSRYYFDYSVQRIRQDASGAPESMELFTCAVLKSTIESYRSMFRRAGFRLKTAMPEEAAYSALIRAYLARGGEAGQDFCLVDIGHRGIRLHILKDDSFVTRRSIDLGLLDLERAVADRRGVDIHMAHTHLLTDYEGAASLPESQEIYHRMAVEIMKAVNFYNYNNRDKVLERIYLCGGGGALSQIPEAISELTDLQILPVSSLMPETGSDSPWLFPKALGCALQE